MSHSIQNGIPIHKCINNENIIAIFSTNLFCFVRNVKASQGMLESTYDATDIALSALSEISYFTQGKVSVLIISLKYFGKVINKIQSSACI